MNLAELKLTAKMIDALDDSFYRANDRVVAHASVVKGLAARGLVNEKLVALDIHSGKFRKGYELTAKGVQARVALREERKAAAIAARQPIEVVEAPHNFVISATGTVHREGITPAEVRTIIEESYAGGYTVTQEEDGTVRIHGHRYVPQAPSTQEETTMPRYTVTARPINVRDADGNCSVRQAEDKTFHSGMELLHWALKTGVIRVQGGGYVRTVGDVYLGSDNDAHRGYRVTGDWGGRDRYRITNEQRDAMKAAQRRYNAILHHFREVAPQWTKVDEIHYADNSIVEVQEDKDGNRRTITLVQPHGDVCF